MTVRELWQRFRAEYVRKKSDKRSERTLEFYDHIWGHHLLPRIGASRLSEPGHAEAGGKEVGHHCPFTLSPWMRLLVLAAQVQMENPPQLENGRGRLLHFVT